ncbi:hypothetical protein MY10362_009916, partial [Beauveria mimosiformis]
GGIEAGDVQKVKLIRLTEFLVVRITDDEDPAHRAAGPPPPRLTGATGRRHAFELYRTDGGIK